MSEEREKFIGKNRKLKKIKINGVETDVLIPKGKDIPDEINTREKGNGNNNNK